MREAQWEAGAAHVEVARSNDVAQPLRRCARLVATLDVNKTWRVVTEVERRLLIDELIEEWH